MTIIDAVRRRWRHLVLFCTTTLLHPKPLTSSFGIPFGGRVRAIRERTSTTSVALASSSSGMTDNVKEDPFAAFGDDDGEDKSSSSSSKIEKEAHRNVHNGVLAFHSGTEQALLLFVQQQLLPLQSKDATSTDRRKLILKAVDQFCVERHWMMHVGPDKGVILQDFLKEHLKAATVTTSTSSVFVLVELGTYCGYSTIRMADTILATATTARDFHIFTVDVNPQTQAVAKQLVEAAGLADHVSYVLLDRDSQATTTLTDQLRAAMKEKNLQQKKIQFLFVDHAKELYLSDVQQLEATGLIQAGTAVAADNVVFFELHEYRQHMASLQASGIVTTKLISDNVFLEYVSNQTKGSELLHSNDPNLNEPPNPESELRDGLGTFERGLSPRSDEVL